LVSRRLKSRATTAQIQPAPTGGEREAGAKLQLEDAYPAINRLVAE
jgi:hypothetical protein